MISAPEFQIRRRNAESGAGFQFRRRNGNFGAGMAISALNLRNPAPDFTKSGAGFHQFRRRIWRFRRWISEFRRWILEFSAGIEFSAGFGISTLDLVDIGAGSLSLCKVYGSPRQLASPRAKTLKGA